MALNLGELNVTLGANTREFDRKMASARSTIASVGRQMRSGINTAGRYGIAIGGAAAALGGVMVSSSLRAQRNLRNLREETGLNLRTIQGLQSQAREFGIEQDQVSDTIRDFAERMGEARTAGGEMKEGFEILEQASGVNIDLTKDLNTVMGQYIEAMANTEDAQTRAAVAAMVMSDAGREMAPVFAQGTEAINRAAMEARDIGAALNEIELRQVAQARIALSRMEEVVDGVSNRLTVALSPILTTLGKRLRGAAKDADGFRDTILNAMEFVNKGVVVAKSAVVAFQVAWKGTLAVGNLIAAGWADIMADLTTGFRKTANFIIARINDMIAAVNALPFTDTIQPIEEMSRNLEMSFGASADQARQRAKELGSEIHDLIMNADSLDEVSRRWREIRIESRLAAEQAAEAGTVAVGGPNVTQGDQGRFTPEAERQQKLEAMRESFMSEMELQREQNKQRMEQLRKFKEQELITEQEFRTLAREQEMQHQRKMTEIANSGELTRAKFAQQTTKQQVSGVVSSLKTMTAGVARENKEMFKINKAAGIASAIINTHEAVSKALSAYPPPLSFAMAAAQAAAGFARVNAIKSQSFGGGSGAAPSVAGSAAATPVSNVGASGNGGGEARTLNATFQVEGDSVSKRQLRGMMDNLNEAIEDGAQLGNVRVE